MNHLRKLLLILILIPISCLASNEDLVKLLDSTRKERNDSIRILLNDEFYVSFHALLKSPGFNPDSIRNIRIGQVAPSDRRFIFYNWNIQQNTGENIYSAIIYFPLTGKTIQLENKYSEKKLIEDSVFNLNDWPGALYYKAIPPRKKTENYYLIFGWDRFDRQTSRKTIEAITFIDDSAVIFGNEVFKTKDGKRNRVVIEYASTANMTLHYSKQKLTLTGVRRSQRNINDSIIVIDRLIPLNEGLEGQRWAYVPAGNIYDGYIYFKGYWTFVEGINARNPAIKREDHQKRGKPELELLPK